MKKKNLVYSLIILALIALIAGIISYATEMRPTQKKAQQASGEPTTIMVTSTKAQTTTAVKKKACECCAERIARLQEQIRKARQRRQTESAESTVVSQ